MFLKQTALKRSLSPTQLAWKVKINRRILAQTVVQRRTQRWCRCDTLLSAEREKQVGASAATSQNPASV